MEKRSFTEDTLSAARSELAYLKTVAEDRGDLPALIGWHLVGIGSVFGLDFLHIWAVHSGLAPWPQNYLWLVWVPGVLAYVPVNLAIGFLGRGQAMGPTARAFGASWAAIAIMSPAAVLTLAIAQQHTGFPFYLVWPSLAFVLYGGAWCAVAVARASLRQGGVALGCFVAALLAARLIGSNAEWLLMTGAFFALVLFPGWTIVRRASKAAP